MEGTRLTVRTDQDLLKLILSITESSGRLTRWRFRLLQLGIALQYRPGRLHQVPKALLRILRPQTFIEAQGTIGDEIMTFEVVNILQPYSLGSRIFVATRRVKWKAKACAAARSLQDQERNNMLKSVNV